jgi:protein SCO1
MTARPLIAALVAAVMLVSACGGDEPRQLAGYTREPAPTVDEVALPDLSQGGADFHLRAEAGQLLVVYFGFTNCPDVCPTTLADLRAALRQLGDDAARVDLAVVSVDPERDMPVLVDYAQTFVDDAHALATDDPALLRAAADPFGVSYLVTTDDEGRIEVAHTSQMFVVDDQGRLVLTWQFGIPADDLAADLRQLIEGASA